MISKLSYKLYPKIIAFFVLIIFSASTFFSVICFVTAADEGYYSSDSSWETISETEKQKTYRNYVATDTKDILYDYLNYIGNLNYLKETYSVDNINAYFEIYIGTIKVEGTLNSLVEQKAKMSYVYFEYTSEQEAVDIYKKQIDSDITVNEDGETLVEFTIIFYPTELYIDAISETLDDNMWLEELLYVHRNGVIALFILSLSIAISCFMFLVYSIGRKENFDGVYINWFNKIPFDVLFLLLFIVSSFVGSTYYFPNEVISVTSYSLVLLFVLSACVRLKSPKWWQNTAIYKLKDLFIKLIKYIWNSIFSPSAATPVIVKVLIVFAVILLAQFILALSIFYADMYFIVIALIEIFIIFPFILIIISWTKNLGTGAKEISKGNSSYKIDSKKMLLEFRELAENINNIGGGINLAVEEKMKSERLKTELITNVSHDIKTPLTSIINYVDLIKKEDSDNENIREYTKVLERQSHKLKRLITDVVDASKLSTGNIETNLCSIDIAMIITQVQGEYYDKLMEKNLQIHLRGTDKPIMIMADPRHLQRVFDNLINNIIKYTMEGTRVYLDLKDIDGKAIIEIKNISKYQLNISEDELMERFVRGDSSRNTEGNGLGLSITQSLINAQNGEMSINIDGDLFKVTIKFNKI